MEPTPRRIHRLTPQLANQIAAGEVVERPASVVKELVENSIDAGADEIVVEVEQGGTRLLRVRDDGHGVHPEDLPLALARHATSKIASPRDLLGILSLGFRGEALASIASVSRFAMKSRIADEGSGWQIDGDGNEPRPCAHPVGTTVEVHDLFFNVPARRKFLRSERTEYEQVEETVRRQALARFHVGFSLRHNDRQVFTLRPAADELARERRLATLIGRAFVENALAVQFDAAGFRLRGWVGRGTYTRSQADVQYVFLNGRVIRDKLVNHALRQSFGDSVPEGRYPAYVLYLEMDPAQVDVNVHPTKHEVRFRDARLVHDFLMSALREAQRLGGATAPASAAPPVRSEPSVPPLVREADAHYRAPAVPTARMSTAQGRFLFSEMASGGLLVVDRKALAAAEVREALASGGVASRPLLFPRAMTVDAGTAQRAERTADAARASGFDFQRSGDDAVLIRAVPVPLASVAEAAVRAYLDAAERDAPALADALAAVAIPDPDAKPDGVIERARVLSGRYTGIARELAADELFAWLRKAD